jgi:hypothetical protein
MLSILLDCSWKPWTWGECILEFVTFVLRKTVEALILLIFEPILRLISDAVASILTTLGTFWINFPTAPITRNPNCTGGGTDPCGGASREVAFINEQLLPVTIAVATASVIIAGARMAWSHRGEPARDLLRSLLTLLVVSSAGVSVIALLISAGDAFSSSVLRAALADGNFGERVSSFLVLNAVTGNIGMLGLMIVLGILAVLASLFQIVLLIVRSGMLVLLVGVFPLAAAFTNTEMGRAWFKKIVTWITAFLLYKPVAALIYATSIKLVGGEGAPWNSGGLDNIGQQIVKGVTGLMMMFLALFALPALMRLTTPLVAATAGGQGFGQILGGVMAKQADKLAEGADSGGSGPSGAQNVGQSRPPSRAPQGPSGSQPTPGPRPPSQPPSQPPGQPPGQPSGPSPAPTPAPGPAPGPAPAPAAAGGGATAGAGAGAGAGGAAAGGAAAAAGPAAVAVVAIQAARKVAYTARKMGDEAIAQTYDDQATNEGPSGSS